MQGNGAGLQVRRLRKTYPGGIRALVDVDLTVRPGLYGLLGPNGAGKSTLMRTLATLQQPDSGSIMLDGVDALANPDYVRSRLGYLPQQIGTYPTVTGRQLLDRFAWLKGRTDRRARRREVTQLLERVNLRADADRAVATYSGGMLRRFGIALALAGDPRLLIVDEPTAGLDPAERSRFHRVLADIAADNIVLLSTHIVDDVESLCERLSIMAAGRIVAEGTPGALAAPLEGRLWSCVVPRGKPVPDTALHVSARPAGAHVVVEAADAPGGEWTAHAPLPGGRLSRRHRPRRFARRGDGGMSTLRLVGAEAWHEFRAACRGPIVPLVFVWQIAYLLIVITNADYMRDWGAIDVARNSSQLVYLMVAGQSLMLAFVWAWIFGQVVVRDRTARLHEIVLAAPVSLRALLVGRYLGALGLALLLSLATAAGFLLVPLLGAAGLIPADGVGPHPWFAIAHSLLIFTLPSAAGVGALQLCAAIRTRGIVGPFAVATGLMLIWMVSMVVIRGGDGPAGAATLLDASGFAEVQEQTDLWTPREKAAGVVQLTRPLVVNRVLWMLPPLLLLAGMLRRVRRERLALEPAPAAATQHRGTVVPEAAPAASDARLPSASARPSWVRAARNEAVWHFSLAFRGWGTLLALGLAVISGVGGSIVHIVLHAEGPLLPRPALILPLLGEFYYLTIVFMVAAFVGIMARRDDRLGYGEIADATPAPIGSRVTGRALAAAALTVVFTLTPTVAVWIVPALLVPAAFSLFDPLLYFGLAYAPAMLELCALVLLAHALIRHAGTAHAVSMFCAFVIVVNAELRVTAYPPAEIGLPVDIALSEFTGWTPWLAYLTTGGLFKLALAACVVALAWLAWPRGTALTVPLRWRMGWGRVAGSAGALAAAGIALAAGSHGFLYEQLVTLGGYQSTAAETADDAAWEKRWWAQAAPFRVTGGAVDVEVDPAARLATARWRLDGVQSAAGALHGSLPHGAAVTRATVDGGDVPPTTAYDHFSLPLGACGATASTAPRSAADRSNAGCSVELEVEVDGEGWSAEGEAPWVHPSGVWLRAADVLPALGHDPDRLLRAPRERRLHGLADRAEAAEAAALAPAAGVAPAGDWRWTVRIARGDGNTDETAGTATSTSGRVNGPLDFAAAWWPQAPVETRHGVLVALHGPARTQDASGVLDDVAEMRACVAGVFGAAPAVGSVVQAPRERGKTALHGDLLWLPEDEGWDIAGEDFGRWSRRSTIASALAAAHLTARADLRKEPGAEWLEVGVPGWAGLECVRQADGAGAWQALQHRTSEEVAEALGALDAPAFGVAGAGDSQWVQHYAPLATLGWAAATDAAAAVRAIDGVATRVRAGAPLRAALADAAGEADARALLGPPAASDVLVETAERTLSVAGRRWRWQDGGWQPVEVPIHVTQRFDREGREPQRIGPVPTTVDPADPFTLIDAWPSFERTPTDNIWRGSGSD